jgi:hypothetical protein
MFPRIPMMIVTTLMDGNFMMAHCMATLCLTMTSVLTPLLWRMLMDC